MATAKLENTRMTFSNGGTILARMNATADTVTFVGDGGSNEVTLTNVKSPVLATDAATKGYVDSLVVSGVTWKNSANVATVSGDMTGSTYNSGTNTITWDGVPKIDGAVIAPGNRIVVKDPAVTTGTNSTGIYEFTSTTPFNSSPAVTTPGTGYTGAAGVATTSSGPGTGMIVTTTDDGFGGLASITITTQGSNYLNGDIMTVTGGTGGTFTLSDGELVLTRTADAAAAYISNGSAIFVYSGTVNNDKSFVTTNDTTTTWGGGVTFSVMATAPPTSGSDTQVQYNNNNSFGASPNFTFNKNATTPTLTLGASAGGITTINMGTSVHPAAINCLGIGGITIGSAAGVNINCADDGIKLTASGGSGVAWLKSNLNYVEVNGATSASMIGGTSAIVTATTGPATVTATTGTASLVSTTGLVVLGASTNNWTFSTTTMSSAGAFTAQAAVTSNVALFNTTTSGTITIGNTLSGTGTITIAGSTAAITIGSSGSTSNTLRGVLMNIGSTETTSMNLFARGASGAVVLSAGTAATSGTVNINTVTATTATVSGGAITVAAGGGNTTGAGGALGFTSGAGGSTGNGGQITLTAGAGGATSGNGGSITITAGSAAVSSGGNLTLIPGSGATAGTSGNIIFRLPNAGTSTAINNIVEFQNSAASQIGRMENTGDMYAVTFNATSDIKYKTNIEQLSDPLNQLKKIEGYSFNWKEDFVGYNDRLQYGVVAQQIEEAGLGHLVTGGNGSSKSVNYIGIIPLLIEAIKELSAKLEKAQIK